MNAKRDTKKHSIARDAKWVGRRPTSRDDEDDGLHCSECDAPIETSVFLRQQGLCDVCYGKREDEMRREAMSAGMMDEAPLDNSEREAMLLQELKDPALQDLTVVVMAKRDLEAGKSYDAAMARLQVDADKIRSSNDFLYLMILQWERDRRGG